jgi:hypothetical protein
MHVLAQILECWPEDPFLTRWRLVLNPGRAKDTQYAGCWVNVVNEQDEPDVRCRLVYTDKGILKPS